MKSPRGELVHRKGSIILPAKARAHISPDKKQSRFHTEPALPLSFRRMQHTVFYITGLHT